MALLQSIFHENETANQGADLLRLGQAALLNNRSGILGNASMAVSQRAAGANMSVDVAAGTVFIMGTESSVQGGYYITNDAIVNLAVSAADGSNARKDLVIIRIEDDFYSGSNNQAVLEVVAGTPAGSPAEPNLALLGYKNYLVLAMIDVPAADTTISTGQITDRRFRATPYGGIYRGTSADRTALTGMGTGDHFWESNNKRLYAYDGSTWQLQSPNMPHSENVTTTGLGGTLTATSNTDLPEGLTISNFVKYRADSKLRVRVDGTFWINNALSSTIVVVDIGGTDYTVDNVDNLLANATCKVSAERDITGLAAATIATIKVQWRVSSGDQATQIGQWALTVTETL